MSRAGAHLLTRRRALAGLALLLAGCAAPPPRAVAPRPPRRNIEAFSLEGRLAVHRGDKHYSANVSWQHDPHHDDILLSGPLGQGGAELVRDDDRALLTLADKRQFAAPTLEELSVELFGFSVPLSGMAHWVLGQKGNAIETDAAGRPLRMQADGWSIDLLAWEDDSPDALPSLVELRRDDFEVRLKILDWQALR